MFILTGFENNMIINAHMNSLDKLIEIVHCGNHNKFQNIIVTQVRIYADTYIKNKNNNKNVNHDTNINSRL